MTAEPNRAFSAIALPNFPLVKPGDDLAELIHAGLVESSIGLEDGDVLVVAQKIVSKAEGRIVHLRDVVPSAEARALSEKTGKDPHLLEVILRESNRVERVRADLIIVEHRLGFVCANAGVDRSNVEQSDPETETVVLLPLDPDSSARALADRLFSLTGRKPAVIISDSHGRAFRVGSTGVAIGVAGLEPIEDHRGHQDLFGFKLRSTEIGIADEMAAAASLLMGQTAEATPVVVLRGLHYRTGDSGARPLIRPRNLDLFR